MRNLQEHILQTASELFYRHGVKATGVDAIIKASGVAKMSLYKYFPSKDALVAAYLQKTNAAMQLRLRQSLVEAALAPAEQLLTVFDVFVALSEDASFRGCPFINVVAESGDQPNPAQQAANEFYQQVLALLTELAEQAGARQPLLLARQLSVLIIGAMVSEQFQKHSGAFAAARAAAEVMIRIQLDVTD
jgi:AcrR family transcriptional regulator